MKMKDIQIGEEYAIGAPNTRSRYDSWNRIRGRVTRIGVHGTTSSSWSNSMSERASYVEFEVIEDESAARCGYTYQHLIVKDSSYPAYGGERTPSKYGGNPNEKVLEVNRCLGAHVIMTWRDFEIAVEEHEKREAEAQHTREQKDFEAKDIRRRFKELGFRAAGHRPWRFEFDNEDALEILAQLDMLRQLRLRGGSAGSGKVRFPY